jgi:hypothetical protein
MQNNEEAVSKGSLFLFIQGRKEEHLSLIYAERVSTENKAETNAKLRSAGRVSIMLQFSETSKT